MFKRNLRSRSRYLFIVLRTNIMLQVGFRDDTSYLAVHYGGGRITPRPNAQTASAKEASSTERDAIGLNQHNSSGSSSTILTVAQPNPTATSSTPTPRCSRNATTPTGGRNRHSNRSGGGGGVGGADRGVEHNASALVERGVGGASIRSTLSEQLSSIGKAADDITA